jgi:hypothetical protein
MGEREKRSDVRFKAYVGDNLVVDVEANYLLHLLFMNDGMRLIQDKDVRVEISTGEGDLFEAVLPVVSDDF